MKMARWGSQAATLCLLIALLVAPSSAESLTKKLFPEKKAALSRSDLTAAESIAAPQYQKTQSVTGRGARYGYPYLIAPTLPPFLEHRADTDENEAVYVKPVPSVSQPKTFGSRVSDTDKPTKKARGKKQKLAVVERRLDDDETSSERRLRFYREPTYRNFDELESIFRPRRVDPERIYGMSRRPEVSPRDPFLSPSAEHGDIFYPSSHKYKRPYSSGGRIGYGAGAYDSHDAYDSPPPSYGYDSPSSPYDSPPAHSGYGSSGYGYAPPSSPGGSQYDYNESYSIESNQPIVGDIRKRLLDYAGASDLYEGEPDYLKEVARNRHKYGSIGNNYYPYGNPGNTFRDFHYAESKLKGSSSRAS